MKGSVRFSGPGPKEDWTEYSFLSYPTLYSIYFPSCIICDYEKIRKVNRGSRYSGFHVTQCFFTFLFLTISKLGLIDIYTQTWGGILKIIVVRVLNVYIFMPLFISFFVHAY